MKHNLLKSVGNTYLFLDISSKSIDAFLAMCDEFAYSHIVEASVQFCEVHIDPHFNCCIGFEMLASEISL